MIEVEVRNFQSIEKATIRVEGFTALVGRSNIGKSAIVRAVKAALTGAPSTSFVRHGPTCVRRTKTAKTCKCHCTVHLKAEGFDLLWEKGDALNRYTYNGQVYDKAERGTPDFLQAAFALVKVGDEKVLLQVADQFTPIFLLSETGGVIADVLSDVAHLDRVNLAMRMAEKDRKEATSTRKVREKDVVELTQKLVGYDHLDLVVGRIGGVETHLANISKQMDQVERLGEYLYEVGTKVEQVAALEQVASVVVPDPSALQAARQRHTTLGSLHTRLYERLPVVKALQGVESIQLPEPTGLQQAVQEFEKLVGWAARLTSFKAWQTRAQPVETAKVPDPSGLKEAAGQVARLNQLVARMGLLETQMRALAKAAGEAEAEALAVQGEWDALGVCPTCTQPFHTATHQEQV